MNLIHLNALFKKNLNKLHFKYTYLLKSQVNFKKNNRLYSINFFGSLFINLVKLNIYVIIV